MRCDCHTDAVSFAAPIAPRLHRAGPGGDDKLATAQHPTYRVRIVFSVLMVCAFVAHPDVQAHEIRPALLHMSERAEGRFDVMWKVPMRGDMILGIEPVWPASLKPVGPPSDRLVPGRRQRRAPAG